MHRATETVKNAAAVAEEKADILRPKLKKRQRAVALTEEEKMIAEGRRKTQEYEAKMKLHQTKAGILEEKLRHPQHRHGHHDPVVGHQGHLDPVTATAVNPTTGIPTSSYPLGRHPPGHHKHL